MFTALNNIVLAAAAASEGTASEQEAAMQQMSSVTLIISIAAMVLVWYFCIIRPQKKKDKEAKAMKESLQIGDEIVTIGGITGIVVRINRSAQNSENDSIVIETGGDRNKVRVMMWAISKNLTQHDAVEETVKAAPKPKADKTKNDGMGNVKE